jgi:hypothetical protein
VRYAATPLEATDALQELRAKASQRKVPVKRSATAAAVADSSSSDDDRFESICRASIAIQLQIFIC